MHVGRHHTQRMLNDIENEVRLTRAMTGRDALDKKVMQAMRCVPRNEFVPEHYGEAAFDNGPLPIGHGQTISQPYMVALMTDLLRLKDDHSVLEVGTGSGYQTAILSELCTRVYTIEFIPALAKAAEKRLRRLGYENVECMTGNGYHGWPEHAPYDSIIVTAAASHVPAPLLEQIKPGGRMVIPVGLPFKHQELILVVKDEDAKIDYHRVLGVAFVPMQGEAFDESAVQG